MKTHDIFKFTSLNPLYLFSINIVSIVLFQSLLCAPVLGMEHISLQSLESSESANFQEKKVIVPESAHSKNQEGKSKRKSSLSDDHRPKKQKTSNDERVEEKRTLENDLCQEHFWDEIEAKLNTDEDYELTNKKIVFPSNTRLTWKGKGVLIIKSETDIIFKRGAIIKSTGEGGLILHPNYRAEHNEATIKLDKQDEVYIDFSNGDGVISLFYNPVAIENQKHKYENEQKNWSAYVKAKPGYFRPFMLINDSEDLSDIWKNVEGYYVLNKNIDFNGGGISSVPPLPRNFSGIICFNKYGFTEDTRCRGLTWSDPKYYRGRLDQFLENISSGWGHHLLYNSPPLLKEERDCFEQISSLPINEFCKIEEEYYKLPFLNNQGETILHILCKSGNFQMIKEILNSLTKRNPCNKQKYNIYREEYLLWENSEGDIPLTTLVRHVSSFNDVKRIYEFMCNYFFEDLNQYNHKPLYWMYKSNNFLQLSAKDEEISKYFSKRLDEFTLPGNSYIKFNFWEGIPILKERAIKKEYQRLQKVNQRFFKPQKPNGEITRNTKVLEFLKKFKSFYENPTDDYPFLNINGIPARTRVILILANIEMKIKCFNDLFNDMEREKKYWDREPNDYGCNFKDKFPLKLSFGKETHFFTSNRYYHNNAPHQGNTYLSGVGSHKGEKKNRFSPISVENFFKEIIQYIPQKKLAELLNYSRINGTPLTGEFLIQNNYVNYYVNSEELQKDVDERANYLNKISLLWDLEIARQLYVTSSEKSKEFTDLPVGSAWARYLKIFLHESLDYTPSLFSDQLAEGRKQAIDKISESYRSIFAPETPEIKYWKKYHPGSVIISTREKMHQELLSQYGGGYESEGEAYETSDDETTSLD